MDIAMDESNLDAFILQDADSDVETLSLSLTWCHAETQCFHWEYKMQLERVHVDFLALLDVHFAIPKEHFLTRESASCD